MANKTAESLFPREIAPGIVATRVSRACFYSELERLYVQLEGSPYRDFLASYTSKIAAVKRREMKRRHCEFLVIKQGTTPVAVLAGEGMNEEAFHLRYVGVCPEARRRGIARAAVDHLAKLLAHCHYWSVTALHRLDNGPSLAAAMGCGFLISGVEYQDGRGPMVQTCRILSVKSQRATSPVEARAKRPTMPALAVGETVPSECEQWVEARAAGQIQARLVCGHRIDKLVFDHNQIWVLIRPASTQSS